MKIEFRDVNFAYSKKKRSLPVLDSVSFDIAAGERVAIVGKSGSGKSTILALISGVLVARSGNVVVNGQDLGQLSGAQRATFRLKHVGYVFQDFRLFDHLTARDNVSVAAQLAGCSRKEADLKADELLGRAGLDRRLEHLPTELSGGEKQRVTIARALINNPALILADEPTGALDAEIRNDILELLAHMASKSTLVVVTHDPYVAEQQAQRTVQCVDGVVASGHA